MFTRCWMSYYVNWSSTWWPSIHLSSDLIQAGRLERWKTRPPRILNIQNLIGPFYCTVHCHKWNKVIFECMTCYAQIGIVEEVRLLEAEILSKSRRNWIAKCVFRKRMRVERMVWVLSKHKVRRPFPWWFINQLTWVYETTTRCVWGIMLSVLLWVSVYLRF